MKVLRVNLKVLKWLGIYSHRINVSIYELFKPSRAYFVMLSFILTIVTSVTYICTNRSNNSKLLDIVFALMSIVGILGNTGLFITFGTKMLKVKLLQKELQKIVDGTKY